jgi:hypothetical protein
MPAHIEKTMLAMPTAQFQLMYGLMYPALLGTLLVTAAQYLYSPQVKADPYAASRYAVAGLLLAFFVVSFYNSSRATRYGWNVFLLDLLELGLMLGAFLALQMVSFVADTAAIEPRLREAFILLFLAEVGQQLFWKVSAVPKDVKPAVGLHFTLAAMALAGAALGLHSQVATVVVSVFASFLLLVYGTEFAAKRRRGE